ncbi:MAG: hypothetical protein R8G66_14155 [Cytophagales bacterium]|nr:hypothetical protein [Cytophagales bacterium]
MAEFLFNNLNALLVGTSPVIRTDKLFFVRLGQFFEFAAAIKWFPTFAIRLLILMSNNANNHVIVHAYQLKIGF